MQESLGIDLLTPDDAARQANITAAANGVRYGALGRLDTPETAPAELARLVGTVPVGIARALTRYAYLFVPLALSGARLDGDETAAFSANDRTLIAPAYTAALADKAICHRNARVGATEFVMLSSRLHADRFALTFEFFINVAHNFVDAVGPPASFGELVWKQATANVRGETSIDAWEERAEALGQPITTGEGRPRATTARGSMDEKARTAYQAATFADSLAIYLLSLYLDFDYADLREREYPLLAAPALAERLRAVHKLFPPNDSYSFQILYRRRTT